MYFSLLELMLHAAARLATEIAGKMQLTHESAPATFGEEDSSQRQLVQRIGIGQLIERDERKSIGGSECGAFAGFHDKSSASRLP